MKKPKRLTDPSKALLYSYITPEKEAEFYARLGAGPIAFTRPGPHPAAPAEWKRQQAAAGKDTPCFHAR
jgi:hypothetical protein